MIAGRDHNGVVAAGGRLTDWISLGVAGLLGAMGEPVTEPSLAYTGFADQHDLRRGVGDARQLTQTGLARLLGWSQPVVARLEAAQHNPSMDTLVALSRTLGLRVHVDVGPKTGVVATVTKSRAA
jgi:hypothetical protein